VSYKHLRVFGCRAFVHIPRDERSKLDKKTKQCIFLGYCKDEFGYRLWDLIDRKVIRSRDVVFFEDQTTAYFYKSGQTESSSVTRMHQTRVFLDSPPPAQGGDVQRVDVHHNDANDNHDDDNDDSEDSDGDGDTAQ